jgi:putative inorganic carbon (HCO3(-)) transporter
MKLASETSRQQAPLLSRGALSRGALASVRPQRVAVEAPAGQEDKNSLAFAGVFLFTLLLYVRPNELLPGVFGTLPIAKTVAIVTLLIFLGSRLSDGGKLTILPIETKMVALIALLGLAWMPLAASPQDSMKMLTEVFLKVGLVFVLMTNVLDTRKRLLALWKLVVVCGTVLAFSAIETYRAGDFTLTVRGVGTRIEGLVGGIFGNPNDLAIALNLLLPLAVALAYTRRGAARAFYAACAAVLAAGVIVTFSRGGFLGLVAMGGLLLWKVGRGRRGFSLVAGVVLSGVLLVMMPGEYSSRILTIFNTSQDTTGSAQERRELLENAVRLAVKHPVVGLGMGNFHIYSLREQEAHNSYVEISAELGVVGLIAYLILIIAPFRSLRRIELETVAESTGSEARGPTKLDDMYYYSVALQAALVAYAVCSCFGSIEYQWYLYYIVAYAVALRGIHDSRPIAVAADGEVPTPIEPGPKGVLWPAPRQTDTPMLQRPKASPRASLWGQ